VKDRTAENRVQVADQFLVDVSIMVDLDTVWKYIGKIGNLSAIKESASVPADNLLK
jgi:hypothetical protein